jgi:hypothetical protein
MLAGVLAECGAPKPKPIEQAKIDPVSQSWYAPAAAELAGMSRRAEDLFRAGKFADAGAVVTKAQPIEARLLAAPRPTLEAMEAASDLDDVYGRMLARDGRMGWARDVFQKNVVRWRVWRPRTEETERRMKQAAESVAECDRRMMQ